MISEPVHLQISPRFSGDVLEKSIHQVDLARQRLEENIGKFKHTFSLRNPEFRREWNAAVNGLGEESLKVAFANVYESLRPFYTAIPRYWMKNGDKRTKKGLKLVHQLAMAFAQIPDETLRIKTIEAFITNDGKDFPYNFLREAGVRAILSVADAKERDRLIEAACNTSGYFARALAVEVIPYHSDPMTQEALYDVLLTDSIDEVRQKTVLHLKGPSLLKRIFKRSQFGNLILADKIQPLSLSNTP